LNVEVNIGEVHSTVRATDGAALLAPEVLECVVAAVVARLREDEDHRKRSEDERRLTNSVGQREEGEW
jgi:hypothetical protein